MEAVLEGLAQALTPVTLGFVLFGVVLGIVVGAIPGLSSPMAIAIAVPLTFYMSPLAAIAFLLGVNKGGEFGGSISAILLNTPGTPEAAATALDGHPLARQGKAGKALKTALYSSVAGDTFSDVVLILVAAPLAVIALKMGPPELLGVLIFAFTFVTALLGKSMIKGLIAAILGVLLSMVGIDPEAAIPRLTFDVLELEDGLSFAGVAIGLLAFSEVVLQIERSWLARQRRRGRNGRSLALAGRQRLHPARLPAGARDGRPLGGDRHGGRRNPRAGHQPRRISRLRRRHEGIETSGRVRQGPAGRRRRHRGGEQRRRRLQPHPPADARDSRATWRRPCWLGRFSSTASRPGR